MAKEKPKPAEPKEQDTNKKIKKLKVVPCQKTFGFPVFTPSIFIDWYINRWLKSLVIDKGTVPMLGKIGEGLLITHFTYMYTTQVDIKND